MSGPLIDAIDSLRDRDLIVFGGKGGVGKTTFASLAALRISAQRDTILFSSDPASNLRDLFGGETVPSVTVDQVEADTLYRSFLEKNLENFLELGDRGTYLDREELRRFFELAIPGIDELMSWLRIGDLVLENPRKIVIVDSAPTGHALRMLRSSEQFTRFGEALESMQQKHRELVAQLTRRRVRDAIDAFLDRFQEDARQRAELLADRVRTAFLPVFLAEQWVVEQTERLSREVREQGIDVPFLILNRSAEDCDCARCATRRERERAARERLAGEHIVAAPQACAPLDSVERLRDYLQEQRPRYPRRASANKDRPGRGEISIPSSCRALFAAGKGGVGKTTSAASIALQLAASGKRTTIISIDPAHGLRDTFAGIEPPPNLAVEMIDTPAAWSRMRAEVGDEIERAIAALTPKGLQVAHDGAVMRQLLDIAPPGADELFAMIRLHDLLFDDPRPDFVVVDTAPTGHFLRFLELPATAGAWVREFMRILLRYSELIPMGRLGEQLVRASRALAAFDALIRSEEAAAIVVTRPERLVLNETRMLLDRLHSHPLRTAAIVVNYLAPAGDCPCDGVRRVSEEEALRAFAAGSAVPLIRIEEQDQPVTEPARLRELVPVVLTSR